MTKEQFYKELANVGVDISDPIQMKVWSAALIKMAQDTLDNKTEQCVACYFAPKVTGINGAINIDDCPNNFCPVKHYPDNAAQMVDYLFSTNFPLDLSAFFHKYVSPIVDKLIEKEREGKDARNGSN